MNNNLILSKNDETIGYYEDLVKEFKKEAKEFIDENGYEQVEMLTELLQDLEQYKNEYGLLVVSDNNGMGTTIRQYKGEE